MTIVGILMTAVDILVSTSQILRLFNSTYFLLTLALFVLNLIYKVSYSSLRYRIIDDNWYREQIGGQNRQRGSKGTNYQL